MSASNSHYTAARRSRNPSTDNRHNLPPTPFPQPLYAPSQLRSHSSALPNMLTGQAYEQIVQRDCKRKLWNGQNFVRALAEWNVSVLKHHTMMMLYMVLLYPRATRTQSTHSHATRAAWSNSMLTCGKRQKFAEHITESHSVIGASKCVCVCCGKFNDEVKLRHEMFGENLCLCSLCIQL